MAAEHEQVSCRFQPLVAGEVEGLQAVHLFQGQGDDGVRVAALELVPVFGRVSLVQSFRCRVFEHFLGHEQVDVGSRVAYALSRQVFNVGFQCFRPDLPQFRVRPRKLDEMAGGNPVQGRGAVREVFVRAEVLHGDVPERYVLFRFYAGEAVERGLEAGCGGKLVVAFEGVECLVGSGFYPFEAGVDLLRGQLAVLAVAAAPLLGRVPVLEGVADEEGEAFRVAFPLYAAAEACGRLPLLGIGIKRDRMAYNHLFDVCDDAEIGIDVVGVFFGDDPAELVLPAKYVCHPVFVCRIPGFFPHLNQAVIFFHIGEMEIHHGHVSGNICYFEFVLCLVKKLHVAFVFLTFVVRTFDLFDFGKGHRFVGLGVVQAFDDIILNHLFRFFLLILARAEQEGKRDAGS